MESPRKTPIAAKLALGGGVALLVASVAYATLGRKPEPPAAAPAAAAVAPQDQSIGALQEAARANPKDPKAWAALGNAHLARDEFADAVKALEQAVKLDAGASGYWSALGEARARASEDGGDPMPPAAVAAFDKALAIDPKDPQARYFMAAKKDLAGDHKGAIDDWFALLADTPPGAPWEAGLRRTIEQVGKIHGVEVATRMAKFQPKSPAAMAGAGMPGPTAEQLEAAKAMTPSQQTEMGRGMVARLEERLKGDPTNVAGWVMLMRSRMTLNEPAKANAALKAAVAANPGAKAMLEGEARSMGVPD